MSWLSLDDVSVDFDGVTALDGVGLDLKPGEFLSVVGPTNAGKSTLLKTIAGLERPTHGRIQLAGRYITHFEPRTRNVSLLFQNIALFPTLSGRENIGFALRRAGASNAAIHDRVEEVAALLKVGHVLDRLPRTFSGGEQQRVAIGRALAAPSDLLMLDEPLTNLDARIRIALRLAFKAIYRDTGQPILYVTHDQVEAMSLSDRIGVLNAGRFEQIGTPDELYSKPKTAFVASFLGSPPMNLLPATLEEADGKLTARGDGFQVSVAGRPTGARPTQAAIGIRPENIVASPVQTQDTPLRGEVLWVERLGSHNVLDIRLAGAAAGGAQLKVRTRSDDPVAVEGSAWFGCTPRSEHILDRATGLFLQA